MLRPYIYFITLTKLSRALHNVSMLKFWRVFYLSE